MKKALSLILCALIIVLIFVSCAETNGTEQSSGAVSVADDKTAEVTEDASEPETSSEYVPNIYTGDAYRGRTFTIFTVYDSKEHVSEFVYNEEATETMITESVNLAIKNRNINVYDALGVEVKEVYFGSDWRMGGNALAKIREVLSSDENEMNAMSLGLYDCGVLTLEHAFYDLNSLDNLDLTNPWWEQFFNESVKMGEAVYFTIGDIGFENKGYTPCVFYNTRLINDLGLEDPIRIAEAGKWTIDNALEYSRSYCSDTEGPEGIDFNDNFGWAGQYDDMYSMLYGAGSRILSRGNDGMPVLTLNTETTIGTVTKILNFMNDDSYICANDYFYMTSNPLALLEQAFEEGRCLFYSSAICTAVALDMDDVFGILPVAKYTEDQEDYYSLINTWCTNALCIGSNLTREEAEFSAAVLDVMGYYSWIQYPDSLAFNYYEKMLKNQKLPREDSEAMLDLIFKARGCEVGSIYRIGAISGTVAVNDMLAQLIASKKTDGFTAMYDTYSGVFENDVQTLINMIKEGQE